MDGRPLWVVVDELYRLHHEACTFLAALRGMGRSFNTEKAYAGRAALLLTWCSERGLNWKQVTLLDLARFLRWLVDEPLPPRSLRVTSPPTFRREKSANAVMTGVCEFLRFCSRNEWVDPEMVARLSEAKYLHWMPPGQEAGEDDQFRTVRARILKLTEPAEEAVEYLTPEDADQLFQVATHARDRFLIALLGGTGERISEALGLRRQDMHLLADSRMLGCRVEGPHIHVRRRANNANGALAKSRFARVIPVTENLVGHYADYQFERDEVPEAADCDMVFVNLFHAPLGRPMRYGTAKELFDRLGKKAGLTARPHMLRHGAATSWIRAGVAPDVVQDLMGQVSPASLTPYLHTNEADKRAAVELVAARRRS
ncbi:tyrosine-type recombinase/integrase [Streptomyces sp. NPDC005279]|uniref:tyrosine-type recombinase/integrase n=1 Tax=Streptomyces sp. NPDC005279 TaxID=3364712 RepID=UPI0036A6723D